MTGTRKHRTNHKLFTVRFFHDTFTDEPDQPPFISKPIIRVGDPRAWGSDVECAHDRTVAAEDEADALQKARALVGDQDLPFMVRLATEEAVYGYLYERLAEAWDVDEDDDWRLDVDLFIAAWKDSGVGPDAHSARPDRLFRPDPIARSGWTRSLDRSEATRRVRGQCLGGIDAAFFFRMDGPVRATS